MTRLYLQIFYINDDKAYFHWDKGEIRFWEGGKKLMAFSIADIPGGKNHFGSVSIFKNSFPSLVRVQAREARAKIPKKERKITLRQFSANSHLLNIT